MKDLVDQLSQYGHAYKFTLGLADGQIKALASYQPVHPATPSVALQPTGVHTQSI